MQKNSNFYLFVQLLLAILMCACNRPLDGNAKNNIMENDTDSISFLYDSTNYEHCFDSLELSNLFSEKYNNGRNYRNILDSFYSIYLNNGKLKAVELEEIMPRTKREFKIYYNRYCSENIIPKRQSYLHYADSLIGIYSYRDSSNLLYFYLNMYRLLDNNYMDEGYLEDFFYGVDFATEKNEKKFKCFYYSLDKKQRETFSSFMW